MGAGRQVPHVGYLDTSIQHPEVRLHGCIPSRKPHHTILSLSVTDADAASSARREVHEPGSRVLHGEGCSVSRTAGTRPQCFPCSISHATHHHPLTTPAISCNTCVHSLRLCP
eukprot:1626365-Rhodomonas_salina.1